MQKTETKETRKVGVRFVTLGPSELSRIANLVDEEAQKESSTPRFTIKCSDGSAFESKDPAIFESINMPIGQIESVAINWSIYRPSYKEIRVWIGHDSDFVPSYVNSIEVTGEDSIWVNGVTGSLQNVIQQSKNGHGILYYLWPFRYFVLYALCSGVIFLLAWSLSEPRTEEWLGISLGVALSPGMLAAILLDGLLRSAFPNVEIRNVRGSRAAKRRKLLYSVVSLILVPILIAVIVKIAD